MDFVATCVMAPGTAPFDESFPVEAGLWLREAGVALDACARPAGGICDLFFSATDSGSFYARFCAFLELRRADVILQPVATRRKRLLVADMESTIIEQETLDEMAAMLGIGEKVADITRRGMNGEIDFAESLRERVALFAGQPVGLLEKALGRITPSPGATDLIAGMKRAGASCWLVSGGSRFFARAVAERFGFDRFFANEMPVSEGRLSGTVSEPVLDKNAKRTLLEGACREMGLGLADSLAMGDGANDLPMLETCNAGGGLGVAWRAKPKVRAAVPHQLNHASMTALLAAQGLPV